MVRVLNRECCANVTIALLMERIKLLNVPTYKLYFFKRYNFSFLLNKPIEFDFFQNKSVHLLLHLYFALFNIFLKAEVKLWSQSSI